MSVNGIGINTGDEYYTPKYAVDYFGEFDYDPATVPEKAKEFGILDFDTIDTDGLLRDWTKYKRIWINPPFTRKYEFIKKAQETYSIAKNEIYILLPIGCLTTKKYNDLSIKSKLFIPNKRINFENKLNKSSPSMGSVIVKLQDINEVEYILL